MKCPPVIQPEVDVRGGQSHHVPAQQHWPEFVVNAIRTFGAASSMSASANTTCADLPPSSLFGKLVCHFPSKLFDVCSCIYVIVYVSARQISEEGKRKLRKMEAENKNEPRKSTMK